MMEGRESRVEALTRSRKLCVILAAWQWGIEDIRFGPCSGIFRMRICMQFHANRGNAYNSPSGFIMIYLVTYWLPTVQQSHRHGTSSADIFPGKIRGGSLPVTPSWPEANLPTWLTAESALLRSQSSIKSLTFGKPGPHWLLSQK